MMAAGWLTVALSGSRWISQGFIMAQEGLFFVAYSFSVGLKTIKNQMKILFFLFGIQLGKNEFQDGSIFSEGGYICPIMDSRWLPYGVKLASHGLKMASRFLHDGHSLPYRLTFRSTKSYGRSKMVL